jgi:peptidoglycan hydrolase CwlO-like protein
MAKSLKTPIDITVTPSIRAIMRRYNTEGDNTPIEVADIQNVIKALSHECGRHVKKIQELEEKIIKQKKELTRLYTITKEKEN